MASRLRKGMLAERPYRLSRAKSKIMRSSAVLPAVWSMVSQLPLWSKKAKARSSITKSPDAVGWRGNCLTAGRPETCTVADEIEHKLRRIESLLPVAVNKARRFPLIRP